MRDEALSGTSGDAVNSNEVMERLGAYVDGELSATDRETVETLLEQDKSCREVVESFRFLDEAARRETVPPVRSEEWAGIWEGIQRQKDVPLTPTRAEAIESNRGANIVHVRLLYRLAAVAAVVVLAVVGVRLISSPETKNVIVQQASPPAVAEPGSSNEEDLDKQKPDEDREDSIAVIDGYTPEIREDGVIYHDF